MFYRVLRLSLLLVVLSLIIFPSQVLALGLGVTPGKLDFSVQPGGTETKTLNVTNQSNQESLFRVYVEGEYEEWFLISPGEFTLAPQQSKGVEIVVSPPLTASDEHDFSICVVSLPPGSNLRIGAGIKVPAHVRIMELPVMAIQWWILAAVLAVVVAVGMLVWRRRKVRHV